MTSGTECTSEIRESRALGRLEQFAARTSNPYSVLKKKRVARLTQNKIGEKYGRKPNESEVPSGDDLCSRLGNRRHL